MGDILIAVLLAALIGFRAGRAVAMDDVGRPIRLWTRRVAAGKPSSRPRQWLVGLFKCPHCCGFHFAWISGLIVSAILLDVDWTVDVIIALASGGLQSLVTTYAQSGKIEVEVKDD